MATFNGMVIYTDGGTFRGNPAPHGFGLYWYLFDNKERVHKQFPLRGFFPTQKGYFETKDKPEDLPEINTIEEFIQFIDEGKIAHVNVTKMYEYSQGLLGYGSNNAAELAGLNHALSLVVENRCDYAIIYTDSEYAIRGLSFLDNWSKKNFITSTGKPVANKEQWIKIHETVKLLKQEQLKYVVRWIKGHGEADKDNRTVSNISNIFADQLASIAASLSNNLIYGLDTLDSNGIWFREITFEDLLQEKKADKIHPLLVNKRLYFDFGGRQNKHLFYIGNPGHQIDNIYIGKQISDAQIGIVYLEDTDPIIEMVEDIQNQWLEQHYQYGNLMYCLQLDQISDTKTYQLLNKYGKAYISRPKGIPNLETVDGKSVTYVHDPVYLAARNINTLTELNNVFHSFREQNQRIIVHDITEAFYETTDLTVYEDLQGNQQVQTKVGKSLKKTHGTNFKFIELEFPFGADEYNPKAVNRKIILTCGVDIPRRNQLKSFEIEFPSVKLITWHYSGCIYHYAFIVSLHEKQADGKLRLKNYGIWRGAHASQILINQ